MKMDPTYTSVYIYMCVCIYIYIICMLIINYILNNTRNGSSLYKIYDILYGNMLSGIPSDPYSDSHIIYSDILSDIHSI